MTSDLVEAAAEQLRTAAHTGVPCAPVRDVLGTSTDVMCERGTPLRAGECLMTGSLGPMKPISPGAEIFADLGALGTVSTRLTV